MIDLLSASHVCGRVMRLCHFCFIQVEDALCQELVRLVEDDGGGRTDGLIENVVIEALLLTLFELGLFFLNDFASFGIMLDLLLQEDPLAVFECSREAIEDVAPVTAIVFVETLSQEIIEDALVGNTDWQ